jgi:hypothetical protein
MIDDNFFTIAKESIVRTKWIYLSCKLIDYLIEIYSNPK